MVDVLSAIMNCHRSAFRLQVLSRYDLGDGELELMKYREGQLLPDRENNSWLQTIHSVTCSDRTFTNLHIFPDQLTSYLKYSIEWWYVYWAKNGASMRFLKQSQIETLLKDMPDSLISDYWLIDDTKLIHALYDQAGVHKDFKIEEDDTIRIRSLKTRDFLLTHSFGIEELLSTLRNDQIII